MINNTKLLIVLLYFIHTCYCNWIAEWMNPVQEKLKEKQVSPSRRMMDDEVVRMVEVTQDSPDMALYTIPRSQPDKKSPPSLKAKLEETLSNAEDLLDKILIQIAIVERKEQMIKDAIVYGRSGVSTVTVSTFDRSPRTYIIRDGAWSLCKGIIQIQPPGSSNNLFAELFAGPKCVGQEMFAKPDPCVYNSVIKYDTVPERRQLEYNEQSFFCLKPMFNQSVEQFLSVPKEVIEKTCKNGIVRSLEDNLQQCGIRVVSEYTYFPHRSSTSANLPLEYCIEKDGSCRMLVAWHMADDLVENFDFLKYDNSFKKYFMKKPALPY